MSNTNESAGHGPLPPVGWVGTGIMGRSMAGHLLAAGHPLRVCTRTRSKAEDLLARGASWASTPAEAAAGASIVCTNVGLPAEVEEVYFGPSGVLAGVGPGQLLVDFGTTPPSLARRIAEAARAAGAAALDAPVSGGDVGARNATLSIMVGGDAEAFERARPLLERVGRTIVHQGEAGAGQRTKIVNQVLVAASTVGMCEALHFGRVAGLDLDRVLASVGGGAAASWALSVLAPRVLKGDLDPGFLVEHLVKDLRIARSDAVELGLSLPLLDLCLVRYEALLAAGHGRKGTQGLGLLLEGETGDPVDASGSPVQ
ncbi:MAG: 2-hydroxy-3-oxopropionate reductase [Planctomycetota bacterium]|jgi:3-hydroxyisobutyrate dehydrogenase